MPLSTFSSDAPVAARRSNALFPWACALVVSLVALAGATEWLVRTQVEPQDTFRNHLGLLQSATQNDAAFGDSHVARGFNAAGGFVNLAYPSENIEYMFSKMRAHFDSVTPGRVIVQADPHLFAAYRLNAPFRPYGKTAQTAPILYAATARHRPQLVAYWAAFRRGFGTLESTVHQTKEGALLSQGDLSASPPRRRQVDARVRIQNHTLGQPQAVDDAQKRYSEMIAFLSSKGAQICLVSFPVSPDYLAALARAERSPATPGHVTAIRFFDETAAQSDARYVDARAHIQEIALFRDVDHLNVAGAAVFSNALMGHCFGD